MFPTSIELKYHRKNARRKEKTTNRQKRAIWARMPGLHHEKMHSLEKSWKERSLRVFNEKPRFCAARTVRHEYKTPGISRVRNSKIGLDARGCARCERVEIDHARVRANCSARGFTGWHIVRHPWSSTSSPAKTMQNVIGPQPNGFTGKSLLRGASVSVWLLASAAAAPVS